MAKKTGKADEIGDALSILLSKKGAIQRSVEEELHALDQAIQPLNELYRRITGGYYLDGKGSRGSKGLAMPAPTEKRTRRPLEAVQAEAKDIVRYISEHPGVKGGEIKKKYPGITGSIKDYVSKYAGVNLKTKGQKTLLEYSVPPAAKEKTAEKA